MKRIFRGRRYDTETAKEVAVYSKDGELSPSDFNWYEERLFRKRNGEFFLAGDGGPLTKYAEPWGNGGSRSGAKIIPLTYEEAQDWAEKYLDGDEYEDIFGTVDETGEKQVTALSLDKATIEMLKRMATASGKTISDVVDSLVKKQYKQ